MVFRELLQFNAGRDDGDILLYSVGQKQVFHLFSRNNHLVCRVAEFGAYFSSLNQVVFNHSKTILGEVSFWYQFPTVDGLNKNKNQYNLDLGIKTLLLDKKIELAVTASDVLKTNQYRFSSLVNHIRQAYNNYYDSRQLRITFRYNFGNEKIKQQGRKPGNEEERRRSN